MRITWRQRLEQQPSLLDIKEWPVIDVLALLPEKRSQFLRNQKIVAQALKQVPLKTIAAQCHLDPSLITHLLNRALGGDENLPPPLTKALIPGVRVTVGRRRKALDTHGAPAGAAHSFNHLLEVVPGLAAYLDKLLRLFSSRSRHGQNLRVNTFHKAFLRFLRQSHWPSDCYPFTVTSQGYESVRKYFHQQLDVLSIPKEPTRIILPSIKPVAIFDEIQIDEHTVDCHGSVVLELNNRWEPLRLSRITLIAARDVASACVLAVLLVLSRSPTKDDLLALLQQLTSSWQPRILKTPGFNYPTGTIMPTALGEDFLRPAFGIIRLDNAMVHRAQDVRDYICDVLGATFNLGIPKYPLARVLIESAFKDLNLTVHRFPSTTGSNPADPLKEPVAQAKKVPVVPIKTLEEAIHIHIAHLNQKSLGNLGTASPIDVMKNQMANHWVPLRPLCSLQYTNPMIGRRLLPVHYSATEHRRPWVNFEHLRYDAPGVLTPHMRHEKIWVEFDRTDLRALKAFNQHGEYLGILNAPATWRRFPHCLSTRKLICNLIKTRQIKAEDPLGSYFDYLLAHRSLPGYALELVRVSRELEGYPQPIISPTKTDKPLPPLISETFLQNEKILESQLIPDWAPHMIEKRRN